MGQYAPPPGPRPGPPPIDESQVRPRKRGYWLGAAGGVLGLVAAGLLIVFAVQSLPDLKAVPSGETRTVRVDDDGLGLYSNGLSDVRCVVRGADPSSVTLDDPGHTESVETNGRKWYLMLRAQDGLPSGKYQVRCIVTDGGEYAIGPRGGVFTFVGLIFGGIALAGLSVLGAGLTALIVGLRRRSHRERLRAQAAWGGPPGPGVYPPSAG
ncbi:hypothetical protein G5C51_15125 [Streptomyces sp. A7024]|uniref:Serine/arginine repetitive matrix protein 2 n=1 Tax=Streptomyces coryli TaxID=1128680 RepID=A0A6G4U0J1_9ACTN|nr:hypothetical protein [Streptomyces coryli]NGN65226.1 hypothetical protein [Streptomyces coryli]